ncbi:hypothetical protein FB567DRAFT_52640 [Paraphoma chrysanthemicola]|uniref:Uncharacterized protein n=1 Tax=Paraphoma chrysanthemicola TaxID=798071 RepID=A0A8K0VXV5_9PLEO|nr:hypothetical protein FB567DRAFT_52640 [Paraphoma chrysanthemicola]
MWWSNIDARLIRGFSCYLRECPDLSSSYSYLQSTNDHHHSTPTLRPTSPLFTFTAYIPVLTVGRLNDHVFGKQAPQVSCKRTPIIFQKAGKRAKQDPIPGLIPLVPTVPARADELNCSSPTAPSIVGLALDVFVTMGFAVPLICIFQGLNRMCVCIEWMP